MKSLFSLFLILFAYCSHSHASPIIINLGSKTHVTGSPYQLELSAGTYRIESIGQSEGGSYHSYSPWGYNTGDCASQATCTSGTGTGYIHRFAVFTDDTSILTTDETWDGFFYADPLLSLANSVASDGLNFILNSHSLVNFYIETGSPLSDNRGGLSFRLTQVSEPSSVLLLILFGMLSLARIRTQ